MTVVAAPGAEPASRSVWRQGLAVAIGQGLSGAGNLVLQLGLALTLPVDRFGTLVVALAGYYLTLTVGRAVAGDPLVADGHDARWPSARRRLLILGGLGAAVGLGAVVGVVPPTERWAVVAIAVALPALLVQDGLRYRAWSRSRAGLVMAMDGLWTLFALGGVVVPDGPLPGLLAAWLVGGIVSALLGTVALGPIGNDPEPAGPGPRVGPGPMVGPGADTGLGPSAPASTPEPDQRPLGSPGYRGLILSRLGLAADANGLPPAMAAVGGSAAGGGMRAAVLPFVPLVTVLESARLVVLPRLRRSVVEGRHRPLVVRVAAVAAITALLSVGAAVVVLGRLPEAWLGPTGRAVAPWFGAAGLVMAARLVASVPGDAVALLRPPGLVVRLRLALSALDWVAALTVLAVAGLGPAIWARAAAGWLGTVVWVAVALTSASEPAADRPPTAS